MFEVYLKFIIYLHFPRRLCDFHTLLSFNIYKRYRCLILSERRNVSLSIYSSRNLYRSFYVYVYKVKVLNILLFVHQCDWTFSFQKRKIIINLEKLSCTDFRNLTYIAFPASKNDDCV